MSITENLSWLAVAPVTLLITAGLMPFFLVPAYRYLAPRWGLPATITHPAWQIFVYWPFFAVRALAAGVLAIDCIGLALHFMFDWQLPLADAMRALAFIVGVPLLALALRETSPLRSPREP